MFLLHRQHPDLENVKFQKYMGEMPALDFWNSRISETGIGYSKHAKSNCLSVSISILLMETCIAQIDIL